MSVMRLAAVTLVACHAPAVAPAPSNGPAPVARIDWYARTTMMTIDSQRRTFHLVRDADRVELDIATETSKHERLDGAAAWTPIVTEHFAGTARHTNGTVVLALDRELATPRSLAGTDRDIRPLPAHLAWTCRRDQLRVHEATSRPIHVGPVSTPQVGCLGSRSEWRPDGTATVDAWLCGPARAHMFNDVELAFTPDKRVEWVAEWIDCDVQTRGYRVWRD